MQKKEIEQPVEVEVDDDLAGLSMEELAEEKRLFAERAERVQWRVHRNAAFASPAESPETAAPRKEADQGQQR